MPSLLEALEQKYGESSTDSDGSEDEGISVAIFVPCKSPRTVVPSLLVLNDCDITSAGEKDALVAKCACVEELDLAKNKLNDWPEVIGILQNMPKLKFVNLSFNHLATPLNVDVNLRWQQLKNLVLNNTYVDWYSIQRILDYLPRLEELHLSLNNYNDVKLCETKCACYKENDNTKSSEKQNGDNKEQNNVVHNRCQCQIDYKTKYKHSGIKKLHFTGNPIDNWREICKLGYAFPNLESLVVAECPIQSLDIENICEQEGGAENRNYNRSESECENGKPRESPHDSFRKLKVINLNSTRLSTWDDIEKLARFPSLHCIRVQGCPLWESNEYTEHERRQLLIARLPNVEMLNGGGIIGHDEREDAERAFIRYYMEKPESDRPERYFELVAKHGKLDPLVNVDLTPEKRVKIRFTCGSNSEVRSVDVYRTVNDLKSKLEPFAGFSASKMRLFYMDQDFRDIEAPEEMRYPNKQLYSYNIRSGDEIIIDCKRKINDNK